MPIKKLHFHLRVHKNRIGDIHWCEVIKRISEKFRLTRTKTSHELSNILHLKIIFVKLVPKRISKNCCFELSFHVFLNLLMSKHPQTDIVTFEYP